MREIRNSAVVLCAVFGSLFLITGNANARTFTYSSYLSASSPANVGIQAFIDHVQKETDGKIKIELYGAGTLTTGKTTVTAIRDGLVDGGFAPSVYTPSIMPVNMVISNMLFFNEDEKITAAAVTDTILNDCPSCLEEFKNLNIHFLAPLVTSPYYMMCAKSFPNGFDPHGLRVRVPGEELGRWVKELGGAPISIANSETYQALQRNALDCAIGSKVWLHTLSWQEVIKTVVNMPTGGYQGGALLDLSESEWKGLDDGTKEIFRKASMYGLAAATYAYDDTAAVANAREKYKVKFIDAPEKILEKRKEFLRSEEANTVKKAKKQGVRNPEKIADAFKKNLQKWQALIGNKNLTQKEYAELLIKEIL